MVIIIKNVITIKALVITLLLCTSVIAHTICQDSLMKIGTMGLKFSIVGKTFLLQSI